MTFLCGLTSGVITVLAMTKQAQRRAANSKKQHSGKASSLLLEVLSAAEKADTLFPVINNINCGLFARLEKPFKRFMGKHHIVKVSSSKKKKHTLNLFQKTCLFKRKTKRRIREKRAKWHIASLMNPSVVCCYSVCPISIVGLVNVM